MTGSESIEARFGRLFSQRLHLEAQQLQARTRPFVMIVPIVSAEDFAYDSYGAVEAMEYTNDQFKKADFTHVPRSRRQITRRQFFINTPHDGKDVRSAVTDPNGSAVIAARAAMERTFDRVVVDAAFADVKTGKLFGTTSTFAQDGGKEVDATGGWTYEKILELNKLNTNSEASGDGSLRGVILETGDEEEALMQELQLTSGDFSRQTVVDGGTIVQAVGNKLIHFGASVPFPILDVTASVRSCVFIMPRSATGAGGIVVGLSKNVSVEIDKRADLVDTSQIKTNFDLGAVRTEGKLVTKIKTSA